MREGDGAEQSRPGKVSGIPEEDSSPVGGVLPGLKVLVYHKVALGTPDKDYLWAVSQSRLRQHLRFLMRSGYSTVTLRNVSDFLDGRAELPPKPVLITFDDGFGETGEIILSTFNEFGSKATVFVLGAFEPPEWERVREFKREEMMDREQIRKLHSAGFEIGSHSMTHSDLRSLPNDEVRKEMSDSKRALENLLQDEIISFAYPYGAVNETIERLASETGYRYGCGVYSGPPKFGTDIYDIRRIPVTLGTTSRHLAIKMTMPYEYYAWLRFKIGRTLGR